MLHSMTEEPTTKPINEDDNAAATKGDLRDAVDELAQATQKGFAEIHTAMVTKTDLATVKEEILQIRSEMATNTGLADVKEEILDEFKVIAENIHQDVAGANKDEVDLLTNQVPDHEERIVDLENKAGLPAGPRFQHVK